MRFVDPFNVHGSTKLIKKLKSQQLSATDHINSSRCPLIECAAAQKKKKKTKKRNRKRRSWIQPQPYCIYLVRPVCTHKLIVFI